MQIVRERLWKLLVRALEHMGFEPSRLRRSARLEDLLPIARWSPIMRQVFEDFASEEGWTPAETTFALGVVGQAAPAGASLDMLVNEMGLNLHRAVTAKESIGFSESSVHFETDFPAFDRETPDSAATEKEEDQKPAESSDEHVEEDSVEDDDGPSFHALPAYRHRLIERHVGFGVPMASAVENTVRTRIFYATDRQPLPDPVTGIAFRAARCETLTLGECEVTFPVNRKVGELPRPKWWKFEFKPDPEKHAMLREVLTLDEAAFYGALRKRLKAGQLREAFVFVHGFNVSFESAALRTAQLAMDLKFDGAPILYSWPSNGAVQDYLVDHNNVALSAARLSAFLANLAHRSGAERVHVIAHSMGNQALCEALYSLSEKGVTGPVVHHVAMAAPDVDADLFRQMSQGICRVAATVTLYASSRDRAIRASRQVNGHPRAGEPLVIVGGVDTVDASAVDTDFLSHGFFSDDRSVLEDLYGLLRDAPASHRFNLRAEVHQLGPYYVFRA